MGKKPEKFYFFEILLHKYCLHTLLYFNGFFEFIDFKKFFYLAEDRSVLPFKREQKTGAENSDASVERFVFKFLKIKISDLFDCACRWGKMAFKT